LFHAISSHTQHKNPIIHNCFKPYQPIPNTNTVSNYLSPYHHKYEEHSRLSYSMQSVDIHMGWVNEIHKWIYWASTAGLAFWGVTSSCSFFSATSTSTSSCTFFSATSTSTVSVGSISSVSFSFSGVTSV